MLTPPPPPAAGPRSLLSRAHQISYVTDDIDAFAQRLRDRFGVADFLVRHDHSRESPASSGAILHLGLAHLDGLEIELIQPHPDKASIYREALGLRSGVGRLHHVNHGLDRRAQWTAVEDLVARLDLPVELSGGLGDDMRFAYPDARRDFGHFLEFSYREGDGPHPLAIPENAPAPGRSLFGGWFQRGYVTRDLDAAMARFSQAYGVTRFHVMRDLSGPGREQIMSRHIALAWTGRFMIELIEPNLDVPNIYAEALPPVGQTAQFHHLGFALPDDAAMDAVVARLERQDIAIAVKGQFGALRYIYADARPELGHYIEYMTLGEQARSLFDQVPQN